MRSGFTAVMMIGAAFSANAFAADYEDFNQKWTLRKTVAGDRTPGLSRRGTDLSGRDSLAFDRGSENGVQPNIFRIGEEISGTEETVTAIADDTITIAAHWTLSTAADSSVWPTSEADLCRPGPAYGQRLTPEDRAAITGYTADDWRLINRLNRSSAQAIQADPELSQPNIVQTYRDKTRALDSALARLPRFRGRTYRVTELPESLIEGLFPGRTFSDPGFMSTSRNLFHFRQFIHPAREHGKRIVFMIIDGRSGRNICPFSLSEGEQEVLFPRDVVFYVASAKNKQTAGGVRYLEIVLRE